MAKAQAEAKAKASTRAKWRSSECTEQYAQKVLDTAGIVRDACLRQPSTTSLISLQRLVPDLYFTNIL
jgi:hypothetical protein